ncbi:protein FAM53B-like [Molossus molossus]|uniref:protein FAM53B-like n=1 Tax=Molossus molossus TaxID=27622 RepID=UPI001745ECB9|nr:protein FAM53B-like [Molossus molossus]
MVMILSKSLDTQGADSIACRTFSSQLRTPRKMSHGPTLFSCGIMENDRWRDLDRKCPLQIEQPSASLWECLPEKCPDGALWHQEAATACAVTNLIQDLSLSDHNGNPSAPPSKRQCRSLSFSDEMSSCRTSWRPLGSKVWTPVEKRRCHSGGSVPRYSGGFGTMQRSSSFSLPSRASVLSSPCDPAGSHHRGGGQPCQGAPGSATCGQAGDIWSPALNPRAGARLDMQRSLSCSHEQFPLAEYCAPSASSTPACTPELARRPSGLPRSRSQPCVLNDKKVGVKRRRPEEVQEQRPSLDLAKMAQRQPCREGELLGGEGSARLAQHVARVAGALHVHSFPGRSASWPALRCGAKTQLCSRGFALSSGPPSSLAPPSEEEVQDVKSRAHLAPERGLPTWGSGGNGDGPVGSAGVLRRTLQPDAG